MFPSESIRVLENTPSRVVILDPPNYSFGAYMLFLGLCGAGIAIFLFYRRSLIPLGYMLVLVAGLLGAFGIYLLTNQRLITLSRPDGTLKLEKSAWGLTHVQATISFNTVQRATVETVKYSRMLVVIMKSGESFALGDGSNRDGYYKAENAINDFLGVAAEQRSR
jgi:hypothetical protein